MPTSQVGEQWLCVVESPRLIHRGLELVLIFKGGNGSPCPVQHSVMCCHDLLSAPTLWGRRQIVLHFYANRALTILQSNPMRQTDICWYIMLKFNIGNVRTRKSSNFTKLKTFWSNSQLKRNVGDFWRFMTRFNVRAAISPLSFTNLGKQDLALPSIKPQIWIFSPEIILVNDKIS